VVCSLLQAVSINAKQAEVMVIILSIIMEPSYYCLPLLLIVIAKG
jgi:hypothetical protein